MSDVDDPRRDDSAQERDREDEDAELSPFEGLMDPETEPGYSPASEADAPAPPG
jgi:hypothetical protein